MLLKCLSDGLYDHVLRCRFFCAKKNARVKCLRPCLTPTRTTAKLLRKAWKCRSTNKKSADRPSFCFRNNTSKQGKIDKWRIGLHVICKNHEKWTASERSRILSDGNLHKFKLNIIVTTGSIYFQRLIFVNDSGEGERNSRKRASNQAGGNLAFEKRPTK